MAPRSHALRVDNERAFVLHAYPYSETSLLVDAFTRDYGRLPLLARGARRPRSALRGVLIGFQPLLLGWSGRGEVRTLMRAEWMGGFPLPAGDALLCGFYLNELLMRMLARDDPHERLFDDYANALARIAHGDGPEPVLRWFEKRLLKEAGYALVLDRDVLTGDPVTPDAQYTYEPERGPVATVRAREGDTVVSGAALLALAADDFTDSRTLAQSKALMRMLINHRLDERPLFSRQMLRDLQRL
jgi:DNA repair protein RecO (recombination protein O)